MSDDPLFLEDEIDTGPPPPEISPDEPAYESFERFGECLLRKRELKQELAQLEKEITRLEPQLLRFFAAHPAFPKMSVHGLTIFRRDRIVARPKQGYSRKELCEALRESGLAHFVHDDFYTSTLSKHIRDLESEHAEELEDGTMTDVSVLLPPVVATMLDINPVTTIVGLRQKSYSQKPKENHYARKPSRNRSE